MKLTRTQARRLTLYAVKGMSIPKIAEREGKDADSVQASLSRARRRLGGRHPAQAALIAVRDGEIKL